jgi:hypothetical protein
MPECYWVLEARLLRAQCDQGIDSPAARPAGKQGGKRGCGDQNERDYAERLHDTEL